MTDWKRVKTGVGGSQKGKTYFYEIFIKIACLFKILYLHLQNVKHTLQYLPDKLFNPNRSLEKASCHFLMTAIRKIALYMLDS